MRTRRVLQERQTGEIASIARDEQAALRAAGIEDVFADVGGVEFAAIVVLVL